MPRRLRYAEGMEKVEVPPIAFGRSSLPGNYDIYLPIAVLVPRSLIAQQHLSLQPVHFFNEGSPQ